MSEDGFWRNRIVGHDEVDPEQLLAHPYNWRIHPKAQQNALETVLDEIGWVQQILVNQRTGFVIDGHLRVAIAISKQEPTIPVNYVDLSEEEETLILATLDPLAALAVTDSEKLQELFDSIQADDEKIRKLLNNVAKVTKLDSYQKREKEEEKARYKIITCPECNYSWEVEVRVYK